MVDGLGVLSVVELIAINWLDGCGRKAWRIGACQGRTHGMKLRQSVETLWPEVVQKVVQEARELAGGRAHFRGGLVGDPGLNRWGLHPLRMATTDALLSGRRTALRLKHLSRPVSGDLGGFFEDGVAIVHPFFPTDVFEALRAEVRNHVDEFAQRVPLPRNQTQRGFGKERPFDGGFDRFDGGTLNRLLSVNGSQLPLTKVAIANERLAHVCEIASGFVHDPDRFSIYQTVRGAPGNHDIQQDAHRDTFHSTVKLWLFLDAVTEAAGPFGYSPGSHRIDGKRYAWEYLRANEACAPDAKRRSGAFRVSAAEQKSLGISPIKGYPVPANTLVLADVRGIHCRMPAKEGAQRLALYASLRKWPFAPVPF